MKERTQIKERIQPLAKINLFMNGAETDISATINTEDVPLTGQFRWSLLYNKEKGSLNARTLLTGEKDGKPAKRQLYLRQLIVLSIVLGDGTEKTLKDFNKLNEELRKIGKVKNTSEFPLNCKRENLTWHSQEQWEQLSAAMQDGMNHREKVEEQEKAALREPFIEAPKTQTSQQSIMDMLGGT